MAEVSASIEFNLVCDNCGKELDYSDTPGDYRTLPKFTIVPCECQEEAREDLKVEYEDKIKELEQAMEDLQDEKDALEVQKTYEAIVPKKHLVAPA